MNTDISNDEIIDMLICMYDGDINRVIRHIIWMIDRYGKIDSIAVRYRSVLDACYDILYGNSCA